MILNNAIIKRTTAALSALVVFSMVSGTAFADQYDSQIAALRQQAAAQAASAAQLHSVASGYQEQVQKLNIQISQLRTQIALNNAKSAKLDAEIADAQVKLRQKSSTG